MCRLTGCNSAPYISNLCYKHYVASVSKPYPGKGARHRAKTNASNQSINVNNINVHISPRPVVANQSTGQVNALKYSIDQTSSNIESLAKSTSDNIIRLAESTDEKITKLTDDIGRLNLKVEKDAVGLTKEIKKMRQKVESLQQGVKGVDQRISNIEDNVTIKQKKINEKLKQIKPLKNGKDK